MTYPAAIAYLYGLQKHGIKLGLETMRSLARAIGNPERRLRVLHIGGTNGKGSTAAMAAAMLEAAGLRVGLYTSPHLVDFRERIKVNGRMIGEDELAELVDMVRSTVPPSIAPTFFEVTTAVAFRYFADSSVDVAVVEVGLGGRFDATNVVRPIACAITTIGLDHEEYLGHTEEAIAFEKAGIIKPGVPIVAGRIGAGAGAVIERVAAQREAPLWSFGREFFVTEDEPDRFTYRGPRWAMDGLGCRLVGRHQLDNAACAIALLEAAGRSGLSIGEDAVRQGLQSVAWEGRLEMLDEEPPVLLDGAHNPAAAAALARYLDEFHAAHRDSRVILVWGMMRDKDRRAFIAPLLPFVSEIVLTQAGLARSAVVEDLRRTLEGWSNPVWEEPCPAEALRLAKQRAAARDLICVTGSLMLLGDVKAALRGGRPSVLRG
ncbi:bifunctional folylpolyglutamate synthase/dihydrofolate synthase [Candidatus Nitrospira inopinata]|jgi:dihydrofolate synthase/folylpolyglutamate synthase|uniref:Dihydrofolate synthase/folylpolyglutamate synthase n=1 Tax=Candidatus Nitrospira inopinata TaxID=1715989 RepID=A0A0S4KVG4_9BACT|nr:folylpolyglutamate synthase/dihydrofolate synthase family protein [Candidatus Nitrospira inopinata]CUQ67791.1 Bifunctional protein FolC: Folylpolyglutamate synthase and Dihydrofolate synthase [Candidatus Nitrospira inopinata]